MGEIIQLKPQKLGSVLLKRKKPRSYLKLFITWETKTIQHYDGKNSYKETVAEHAVTGNNHNICLSLLPSLVLSTQRTLMPVHLLVHMAASPKENVFME